ncbi:MAG: cyclase family protein [Thermodesulfobacteriota bacterium]
MKRLGIVSIFMAIFVFGTLSPAVVSAQTPIPWPEKWWPSKWGQDDEKGAFNTMTPGKVLSAMKLVKTGKMYRLGIPYTKDIPLPWGRSYSLVIPGLPVGGPFGKNGCVWNDEFMAGELGQVGTQFDGPGHIGIRGPDGVDRWYNGRALGQDYRNAHGLLQDGVEKVGPCITRGVLIDVAGLKGVKAMEKGEVITVADVEACIKKAGIEPIGEGDAVIFHTGWTSYWKDPAKFNAGEPGIGIEVAKYLIKKNIAMVAADSWAVDVVPGETKDLVFEIHQLMQTVNGIWYLENLSDAALKELVKDGAYEFLWVFVPVPFAGATGSPGDAIAIR